MVQLANRAGAAPETFDASVDDALAAYDRAAKLPGVDPERIICFGEGFGGALALAVAARRAVYRAVALNPYPSSDTTVTLTGIKATGTFYVDAERGKAKNKGKQ